MKLIINVLILSCFNCIAWGQSTPTLESYQQKIEQNWQAAMSWGEWIGLLCLPENEIELPADSMSSAKEAKEQVWQIFKDNMQNTKRMSQALEEIIEERSQNFDRKIKALEEEFTFASSFCSRVELQGFVSYQAFTEGGRECLDSQQKPLKTENFS